MNVLRELVERGRAVLIDAANVPAIRELRTQQLDGLSGEVLEIGVGTGNNLPHYPAEVTELHAADPAHGIRRKAELRARTGGLRIRWYDSPGELLPFPDESFQSVVSTLLLCGARDPAALLAEVHRVLVPGGEYRFLEHGISPDARAAVWQHRLNGLQRAVAGCNLTRDISGLLQESPLQVRELWQRDVMNGPGRLFPLSGGVANRGGAR